MWKTTGHVDNCKMVVVSIALTVCLLLGFHYQWVKRCLLR